MAIAPGQGNERRIRRRHARRARKTRRVVPRSWRGELVLLASRESRNASGRSATPSRRHCEPRLAYLDSVTKRMLDLVGAAALLVVLAPVFPLVALLVRLDSPGPALFRQERVGQGGRPFTMLKFRSMRVDADQRVHAAYVAERIGTGLPLLKLQSDPRVARIGRFLRATSLDELPQLWNVLRSEMSLVGPRPALPYEVELYDAAQRQRLLVKPGITGLAQIHARGKGTLVEYIHYDLDYMARCSLWLDLGILVRTVPAVLRGNGAG